MTEGILEAIVAASQPCGLPNPRYQHAPCPSRVLQLPRDLVELQQTLLEDFSVEALIKAKICSQSPGKQRSLTPWFTPAGLFLPLQPSTKKPLVDLLGDAGCLQSSSAFALNAVCSDYRTRRDADGKRQ